MKIFAALALALLFHGNALGLTIATGSTEGTYFKIAQDIKQIADKEGIPLEVIPTNGSFDNINLLGAGKVDLAILQLDVLRFVTEIMLKETGMNVLQEAKVVLNLYPEEIHVLAKNKDIRTFDQLQGQESRGGPGKERFGAHRRSFAGRIRFDGRASLRRAGTGDQKAPGRRDRCVDLYRRRAGAGLCQSRSQLSLRGAAAGRRSGADLFEEDHRKIGLCLGRRGRDLCGSLGDHDAKPRRERLRHGDAEDWCCRFS